MKNAREVNIKKPIATSLSLPKLTRFSSETKVIKPYKSPELFSYERYSALPKIYPEAKFRMSPVNMKKWLSTKCDGMDEIEETDNYIETDEFNDEEIAQNKMGRLKSDRPFNPLVVGSKAMADFFDKYKTLNKITSSAHERNPLPVYQYLTQVDHNKGIPQPMGIVKRTGFSNEILLQYIFHLTLDLIRWEIAMQLLLVMD